MINRWWLWLCLGFFACDSESAPPAEEPLSPARAVARPVCAHLKANIDGMPQEDYGECERFMLAILTSSPP